MEANELRIGNLVLDDYSGRMIVSAINPYDGMYNHESGVYLCKNNNLPSGYYFLGVKHVIYQTRNHQTAQ